MKELFKSKKLYISLIILVGIIFLILVNFNRAYESKGEILITFKSEKAAQNSSQILENLKLISQSLPFYEKVISDEPDAKNELILELPNYKQKQYWNETVKIERVGESSALEVSAVSFDSYTAQVLSSQTIKTLISVAGVYYDIEKDIDIKIINPPITRYTFVGSYIQLIIKSAILGIILIFLLACLLTLILNIKPNKDAKAKVQWSYKKELPIFNKGKREVLYEKRVTDSTKKAAAPANLPISEEDEPIVLEKEKPLTHEATSEEVKERLNKLLNGEI
jgi:hypothetical protein